MLPVPPSAYLARIGDRDALTPAVDTLQRLHLAHLLHVPFENLDIHLGRPIVLDVDRLYQKIVDGRRGGFCYELNGLFAALLDALGSEVTLLSARVARADGGFGPEFDHLVLLVQARAALAGRCWFRRFVPRAVALAARPGFSAGFRDYRLQQTGETWSLQTFEEGDGWQTDYAFTLQPHALADFAPMCHYQQTSPASHFTHKRVCSRHAAGSHHPQRPAAHYCRGARREERALADEGEVRAVLLRDFGIALGSEQELLWND